MLKLRLPGAEMKITVPASVLDRPPGSLNTVADDHAVTLFLREDEWGRRYSPGCAAELRLGRWEIDDVLLTTLLLRVARRDETTFECWINVATAVGLRIFQLLTKQDRLDIHVVTDRVLHSFTAANRLQEAAQRIVDEMRSRRTWSSDEFECALGRLSVLYPSPQALWWRREWTATPVR